MLFISVEVNCVINGIMERNYWLNPVTSLLNCKINLTNL